MAMLIAKSHKPSHGSSTAAKTRFSRAAASKSRPSINPLWHQLSIRVQPKLEVGTAGDAFEQEADRVAEQVIRTPDPTISQSAV
jgi:hypothetical protein